MLLPLGLAAVVTFAGDKDADNECKPPKKYSEEYWQLRASDPPGARQRYKFGKLWPPFNRPTGPEQTCVHKYYHAHYWPFPYNCQDRAAVVEAVSAQAANGWAVATTLHDFHFDPTTQQLNEAGKLQLQWILTSVPPEFRTAFVAATFDQAVNQVRLASVQQVACDWVGSDVPPILIRNDLPTGRPAVEIDLIRRAQLRIMPRPQLLFEVGTGTMTTNGSAGGLGGAPTVGGASGAPTGGSGGGTRNMVPNYSNE